MNDRPVIDSLTRDELFAAAEVLEELAGELEQVILGAAMALQSFVAARRAIPPGNGVGQGRDGLVKLYLLSGAHDVQKARLHLGHLVDALGYLGEDRDSWPDYVVRSLAGDWAP